MNELKRKHIRALQNAIHEAAVWRASSNDPLHEAAVWRGSFEDAEQRAEWDIFIATAQEGLNIIKKEWKNERARTDSRVS